MRFRRGCRADAARVLARPVDAATVGIGAGKVAQAQHALDDPGPDFRPGVRCCNLALDLVFDKIGVQYGNIQPGDTVAVVGAGPVGMSCLLTAQLYSPSQIIMVDMDDNRLALAKEMGATDVVNSGKEDAIARILALTGGRGVDCAIEAVGIEPTWNICQHVVKEGGHVANVGVHGKPVMFDLDKLWIKNLTITTGLVNANTTGMLMKTCCSGDIPMQKLVTHHFKFAEIEKAYDVFKHAADEKAMKVIVDFDA